MAWLVDLHEHEQFLELLFFGKISRIIYTKHSTIF